MKKITLILVGLMFLVSIPVAYARHVEGTDGAGGGGGSKTKKPFTMIGTGSARPVNPAPSSSKIVTFSGVWNASHKTSSGNSGGSSAVKPKPRLIAAGVAAGQASKIGYPRLWTRPSTSASKAAPEKPKLSPGWVIGNDGKPRPIGIIESMSSSVVVTKVAEKPTLPPGWVIGNDGEPRPIGTPTLMKREVSSAINIGNKTYTANTELDAKSTAHMLSIAAAHPNWTTLKLTDDKGNKYTVKVTAAPAHFVEVPNPKTGN